MAAITSEVILQAIQSKKQGKESEYITFVNSLGALKLGSEGDQFTAWIKSLKSCVHAMTKDMDLLVGTLLRLPWITMDDAVCKEYIEFVCTLVSAHPFYIKACLQMLIKQFTPGTCYPTNTYSYLHQCIEKLFLTMPMVPKFLVPQLSAGMPYKGRGAPFHEVYIRNVLHVTSYVPEIASDVFRLVIDYMLKFDVELPSFIDSEQEEGRGEELFPVEMEADSLQSNDLNLIGRNAAKDHSLFLGSKYAEKAIIKNDMANKLDILMLLCFEHIHQSIHTSDGKLIMLRAQWYFDALLKAYRGTKPGESLDEDIGAFPSFFSFFYLLLHWARQLFLEVPPFISDPGSLCLFLYLDLLLITHVFGDVILPTCGSTHVQFILFYLTSLSDIFVREFLDFLWSKFVDVNTPTILRVTCMMYMASYVARGKFISLRLAQECISLLVQWTQGYIDEVPTANLKPDHERHTTFYSACQCLFYLIVIKHKELLSALGMDFFRKLYLDRIVTSKLNPLKFCLEVVAEKFARVTKCMELVFCYSILEQNRRLILPATEVQVTVHALPKISNLKAHLSSSVLLDSYFPFDPYRLSRSKIFVEPIYVPWAEEENALSSDDEVEQSVEEDPFLDPSPGFKGLTPI